MPKVEYIALTPVVCTMKVNISENEKTEMKGYNDCINRLRENFLDAVFEQLVVYAGDEIIQYCHDLKTSFEVKFELNLQVNKQPRIRQF